MKSRSMHAMWLVITLGLVPGITLAGDLRGSVGVLAAHRQFSRVSGDSTSAGKRRLETMIDAVVYLDSIPARLEKKLSKHPSDAVITQRGGAFSPRTLSVPVGTTVTFLNRDRVYHSVFSVSPARRFDLGKYAPGEGRQVALAAPGPIQLFCDIDPNETGFVFVTPNHASARPGSRGEFAFRKLPPGRYTLRVWHPSYGSLTREIEMPRHGDLEVALEY